MEMQKIVVCFSLKALKRGKLFFFLEKGKSGSWGKCSSLKLSKKESSWKQKEKRDTKIYRRKKVEKLYKRQWLENAESSVKVIKEQCKWVEFNRKMESRNKVYSCFESVEKKESSCESAE